MFFQLVSIDAETEEVKTDTVNNIQDCRIEHIQDENDDNLFSNNKCNQNSFSNIEQLQEQENDSRNSSDISMSAIDSELHAIRKLKKVSCCVTNKSEQKFSKTNKNIYCELCFFHLFIYIYLFIYSLQSFPSYKLVTSVDSAPERFMNINDKGNENTLKYSRTAQTLSNQVSYFQILLLKYIFCVIVADNLWS